MKTSHLVLGIGFIAFGLIQLGEEFDLYHFNWSFIGKLWPLVLIFIGIRFLTKNRYLSPRDDSFPNDPQAPHDSESLQ
ncbi:MAG: DUF5668 domain-containing protein [Siphonobacter sp.]